MRGRMLIYAVCLLGAAALAACGSDDTSTPGGTSGAGGKGNAGSSGKAGSGNGGKSSGGNTNGGGGNDAGTSNGMSGSGGEGGEAGIGPGPGPDCTNFSAFVHDVIKNDTNETSVPRPVNAVVFCADPANPAAFNDLF